MQPTQYPELDPALFKYEVGASQPTLHPKVRTQIYDDLSQVIRVVPVTWMVLTGPALQSNNPTAPLRVIIGIENAFQNFGHYNTYVGRIQNLDNDLNKDSYVKNTKHPLQYVLTTKSYYDFNFADAYAFMDDKWLSTSFKSPVTEKIEVERPTSRRAYMKNLFRSTHRKNKDLIPDLYQTKKTDLQFSITPFKLAKERDRGMWKLTRGQAMELAKHFHLAHLPKRAKPFKMLGNTGIMMFRPAREKFFLLKGPVADKIKKKFAYA